MVKLPSEVSGVERLLFWGVGGSRSYGLAEVDSDLDLRGVYVAPTENFFKFTKPKSEYVITEDSQDVVIHEIEKFLLLICKGNHNAISDLYIDPIYIGHIKFYNELQKVVPHIVPKDEYFECVKGVATQARTKIERVHLGQFQSSDLMRKYHKEVMHAIRIINTATKFMATKQFDPKVPAKDVDLLLSIKHGQFNPTVLLRMLDQKLRDLVIANHNSQLRAKANTTKAEQILNRIRRNHEFYKA